MPPMPEVPAGLIPLMLAILPDPRPWSTSTRPTTASASTPPAATASPPGHGRLLTLSRSPGRR